MNGSLSLSLSLLARHLLGLHVLGPVATATVGDLFAAKPLGALGARSWRGRSLPFNGFFGTDLKKVHIDDIDMYSV